MKGAAPRGAGAGLPGFAAGGAHEAAPSRKARPAAGDAGPGRRRGAKDFQGLLELAHAASALPQGASGARPPGDDAKATVARVLRAGVGSGQRVPAEAADRGRAAPRDGRRPPPDANRAQGEPRADERRGDAPPGATAEPGFAAAERAAFTATAAPTTGSAPAPLVTPASAAPAGPPPTLDASQTLLQLAMTDSSLTVDVHRQVVNVALHTEATGALELELRLREGRAHVSVAGPSAPLVAQHAPALREVLSQQGLSLGDFSLSQERRPPAEPAERDAPTVPPTSAPQTVTAPTRAKRHEGRIDVEA